MTPLENFVAGAKSEPDLAEELDRADEGVETEVDEETPAPAQQRFELSRVRSTTDAENSAGSSFAGMFPFQSRLWHRHDGSSDSVRSRKPDPKIARHLSWDTLPPGSTQAGHHSYRDFPNCDSSGTNTMTLRKV